MSPRKTHTLARFPRSRTTTQPHNDTRATSPTMLARLQAAAAAADSTHGASQLDELRRAQRERWRAEQASSTARGEEDGNRANAASRTVGSDEGEARPDAQRDAQRDAPARAEAPRASQMDDRGDGGASRGFVFGAALSAGLLGYRAARALQDLFRAEETSSGPEEEERRRKRAQEAADAALAARLQREEQAALAREQASRARPRPQTGAFDPADPFVNHRTISLGPFGVIQVETTSSSRASTSDPEEDPEASAFRDFRDAFAGDATRALDAPFAAALGAALRAHSRAFAPPPDFPRATPVGQSRAGSGPGRDPHLGVFEELLSHSGLELESLLRSLRGDGDGFAPAETGAGDDALARMPVRRFSKASFTKPDADETLVDAPTCAVCMCDAEEGDALRRLPCRHEFHQACVDRWLADHRTCPMCKSDVVEGTRSA